MKRALLGCFALLLVASPALAGGALGKGARVEEESVLVVWDDATKIEHLLAAATLAGDQPLGWVITTPGPTTDDPTASDTVGAFAKLLETANVAARPLPDAGPATVVPQPLTSFSAWALRLGATADKRADRWADAAKNLGKEVRLVRVAEAASRTPYAHLQFPTPFPVVPFGDPPDDAGDDATPPAVDAEHPPRIQLFDEIGIETKHGTFERALDAAIAKLEPDLATCYARDLAKNPRLAGDVHATIRVPVVGPVSLDEKHTGTPGLSSEATCLGELLTKAELPRPDERAAPVVVHATLRPPAAKKRVLRAFVLATSDLEPRLGTADDSRVPPDTRVVASFEPSTTELAARFDPRARELLGLDPKKRHRLVVLESTADPRGDDEIALRPLAAIPPPRPGEIAMPILARGDRPDVAPTPPARPHRRRRIAAAIGVAAIAALLALVLYFELRRRPGDAPRDVSLRS